MKHNDLNKDISKEQLIIKKWYVIQTYSGYEKRVKNQIASKITIASLNKYVGKILVPTEEVVEIKGGQKKKSERKFFPGYVLIQMQMNEKVWQLVRKIPKVNGFLGVNSEKPMPITDREAKKILFSIKKQEQSSPKPKTVFQVGEVVRVLEGPFSDFTGVVQEINYEKSRIHVSVSIFGRQTPIELEFYQVEKDA